jgi:hypothetical protein
MRRMYKRIECRSGFSISVQAGEHAYCTPRMDQDDMEAGHRVHNWVTDRMESSPDGVYTEVECGFPHVTTACVLPDCTHSCCMEDQDPYLHQRMLIYAWGLVGFLRRLFRVSSAWDRLQEYRECGGSTVYPYVPITLVHALIRENGGMKAGDMPPG